VAELLKLEQNESIIIKVHNVLELEQYNELITYLKTFAQITKIDSLDISASMVELKLSVSGDQKNLLEILGSQGKLIKNNSINLEYKWVII
jgi:hypothetical protein